MTKVVQLRRPRALDSRERFIEELCERIRTSTMTQREIAKLANVQQSTINRLSQGVTRWPRSDTTFGILQAIGLALEIVERKKQ